MYVYRIKYDFVTDFIKTIGKDDPGALIVGQYP